MWRRALQRRAGGSVMGRAAQACVLAAGILGSLPGGAHAQRGGVFAPSALVVPPRDGWRTNGGNLYNQRYSPLTAIDRSNVAQLKHIKQPKLAAVGSIQECWKLLF